MINILVELTTKTSLWALTFSYKLCYSEMKIFFKWCSTYICFSPTYILLVVLFSRLSATSICFSPTYILLVVLFSRLSATENTFINMIKVFERTTITAFVNTCLYVNDE